MKLSKEQIAVLAITLSHPFGRVKLVCDDYEITLQAEPVKKLTYRVMTYVNGHFKGAWCSERGDCPEQKFLRKLVKPVCSPARKREMEQVLGKRYVKSNPYYSQTQTSYWPDWASGQAALNHLNRVCESIRLAE